jgi:hypothetical protein
MKNFWSALKRVINSVGLSGIVTIAFMLTLVFGGFRSLQQIDTDTYSVKNQKLENEIADNTNQIATLKNSLGVTDTLLKILQNPKAIEKASIDLKLYQINTTLAQYIQQTNALLEAFNPTKPEQVLTIARLKDAVVQIQNDEKNLEDRLKAQQSNFEDSIKRELATSSNSYYWIMFILLPLIIQFFYNIYKDNRKTETNTK